MEKIHNTVQNTTKEIKVIYYIIELYGSIFTQQRKRYGILCNITSSVVPTGWV